MDVFHKDCILPQGINSSFIALIPKTNNPTQVHHFRLIGLINCTLKILLKLLANRLKPHHHTLVAKTQYAFVKGRLISDCIFINAEIAHSIQHNLTKEVIFKVIFEKAFDSKGWDFLLYTISLQGFGNMWCSWIKSIISTIRLSILINGSPTK